MRTAARGANSAATAAQAGVFQNRANSLFFTVLGDSGDAPVQCFFDFFRDLSSRTPTFETIFRRMPSRNALKSEGLA